MKLQQLALGTGVLLICAGIAAPPAAAQARRMNDDQVRELLKRIEQDSDRFKDSLDKGLDQSTLNDTWEEKEIKRYVESFEDAADDLKERFSDGKDATVLVEQVLTRGALIDRFVLERPVGMLAQNDWKALRGRLDELASAFGVNWRWRYGVPTASTAGPRLDDESMKQLIARIEETTDRLEDALDDEIDDTVLDGTSAEDQAKALVKGLDEATNRLRDRFDDEDEAADVVGRVLWQAERLEDFLERAPAGPRTRTAWQQLTSQLRELSRNYGLEPQWAMRY